MARSRFLLISGILSFIFGAMMFFVPSFGAQSIGISLAPESLSLIRGMGGLIIGSGAINFLMRNNSNSESIKALLLTNIITHIFGMGADIFGLMDGVLVLSKIAPVQITHLFIGVGSLIYLTTLSKAISN